MNLIETYRSKPPGERIKLALIPVLLAGFGAVLYSRMEGPPAGVGDAGVALAVPVADASGSLPVKAGGNAAAREWPRVDLEQVIAANPFRRPQAAAEPEPLEIAEDTLDDPLEEMEPQPEPVSEPRVARRWPAKVQAVFVDSRGAVAIVDSQVVRIGDVMASGATVVEISSTAVTFELVE